LDRIRSTCPSVGVGVTGRGAGRRRRGLSLMFWILERCACRALSWVRWGVLSTFSDLGSFACQHWGSYNFVQLYGRTLWMEVMESAVDLEGKTPLAQADVWPHSTDGSESYGNPWKIQQKYIPQRHSASIRINWLSLPSQPATTAEYWVLTPTFEDVAVRKTWHVYWCHLRDNFCQGAVWEFKLESGGWENLRSSQSECSVVSRAKDRSRLLY
jgi:hypothetical protein